MKLFISPLYSSLLSLTVDASNLGGVVGKCQLLFPYEAGQYGAGEVVSDKRYVTHVPLSFSTSHQHIHTVYDSYWYTCYFSPVSLAETTFHWLVCNSFSVRILLVYHICLSSEARDNSLLTYVAAVCHMKTVCHCCSTGRCSFSHASILCNL